MMNKEIRKYVGNLNKHWLYKTIVYMSKTIAIVPSDFVFKDRTKILHKNSMLNGMAQLS